MDMSMRIRLIDKLSGAASWAFGKDGALNTFASATSSGTVAKSDSTVLDFNAIYVGGTGNVSIDHTEGGAAVVYLSVPAGTILPVSGVRINAATSATNMVWMKW
jgi:hypothetical protein